MTPSSAVRSPLFTADCVRGAGHVLLRVSGKLVDARRLTPDWDDCLSRLAGEHVRVDLGGVTDIDARGLGMLAELTRETRAVGGRVSVVCASPRVRRLLKVTHLDALLDDEGRTPCLAA
ncbi:MAG: STAS domain-containing protein [Vicinamibacterales bacterium]